LDELEKIFPEEDNFKKTSGTIREKAEVSKVSHRKNTDKGKGKYR
jgi:hypothetical protein